MEDNELVFCAHDTGQPVHVTLTSSGIVFDRSLRAICCEYGVRLRHEALHVEPPISRKVLSVARAAEVLRTLGRAWTLRSHKHTEFIFARDEPWGRGLHAMHTLVILAARPP